MRRFNEDELLRVHSVLRAYVALSAADLRRKAAAYDKLIAWIETMDGVLAIDRTTCNVTGLARQIRDILESDEQSYGGRQEAIPRTT